MLLIVTVRKLRRELLKCYCLESRSCEKNISGGVVAHDQFSLVRKTDTHSKKIMEQVSARGVLPQLFDVNSWIQGLAASSHSSLLAQRV